MATISGGQKLEAALREMADNISKPATLRVGFLERSRYSDGKPVALIAAINEWGKPPSQPPRPFFRRMIAKYSPEWPKAIADLLKANNYDAERTLDIAGAAIAGQLRQSIVDLVDPPLAPSTIARKGFSKPLIDKSIMLNSVDHDVQT